MKKSDGKQVITDCGLLTTNYYPHFWDRFTLVLPEGTTRRLRRHPLLKKRAFSFTTLMGVVRIRAEVTASKYNSNASTVRGGSTAVWQG